MKWGEVHASVVTEGPPTCLHRLLLSGHQTATKENFKNGRCSQVYRYLSHKTHSSCKSTWIFPTILCVSFKWYFRRKLKKDMLVLGAHNKDRKSTRDKANIGNPKVNRGCPPRTANHTHLSRLYEKFTWTFNTISTGGLPYWEFQRY